MPVRVLCPNPECLASYSVADEAIGRPARCKKCGKTFRLGDSQADAPIDLPEPDEPDDGDDATTLKPGSVFAHYTIGRLLGRGGMGAVYLATDSKLRRQVALKVPDLPPGSAGTAAGRRFLREARAAAALSHPNICPVYEVGEVGASPYLTMEFIRGEPLDALIRREVSLTPDRAVAIVRTLALALSRAHANKIVHRDLKPSNVLMCPDRGPVLTDFGLAKFLEGQSVALTRPGALLGTPAYMSPEQASAEPIGPASDIFSLGVILYELLTGRRPFNGEAWPALAIQIVGSEPMLPSTQAPGLDRRLDEVCVRALAKQPSERFATMDDFAASLDGPFRLVPSALPFVATESPSTQVPMVAESIGGRVNWSPQGGAHSHSLEPEQRGLLADLAIPRRPARQSRAWERFAAWGLVAAAVVAFVTLWPWQPEKTLTNSVGMTLVRIEPGPFLMGSPDSDDIENVEYAQDDEKPRRLVEITRPYYLSANEVTQEQYRRVTDTNPSYFAPTGGGKDDLQGFDSTKRPVENVSWLDAVRFCNALSRKEGLVEYYLIEGEEVTITAAAGNGYRLPTEAEWEYACLSDTRYRSLGDIAWYDHNSYGLTHPVGEKEPNDFGLHDMYGNVWEWCQDWYDAGHYKQMPNKDPAGPASGADRVLRGGSFLDGYGRVRAATRSAHPPAYRDAYIGFRVSKNSD